MRRRRDTPRARMLARLPVYLTPRQAQTIEALLLRGAADESARVHDRIRYASGMQAAREALWRAGWDLTPDARWERTKEHGLFDAE